MGGAADDEYVEYVHARLAALKRLAQQLCGDEHRADDLVQETITKVFVKWPKIRQVEHMDKYVYAIMVRTHIDDTRRGWFRVRLVDSPPDHATADRPYEESAVVHAALSELPARQRAAVVLRFLYDLPVNEVADMLGCSVGTVKSQTHQAVIKLRARLGHSLLVTDAKEN